MSTLQFDRHSVARRYALQDLKLDDEIRAVYYLPMNASEREIRLLEVNEFLAGRTDDILEPIDFGVDRGEPTEHRLVVLDVSPDQWERIRAGVLNLPAGWTLEGSVPYAR